MSLLVFFKQRFEFQPNVCNECHDSLMMWMNLSDIIILNIKSADYRCIIKLNAKYQFDLKVPLHALSNIEINSVFQLQT